MKNEAAKELPRNTKELNSKQADVSLQHQEQNYFQNKDLFEYQYIVTNDKTQNSCFHNYSVRGKNASITNILHAVICPSNLKKPQRTLPRQ